MSLWGFRFLLWYICILFVQPQNRFSFLWPLKIADIAFIAAVGLHVMGCLESRRPLIRLIDKKSLFRGTGTRPPACACPHADRLEPV